MLHRHPFGRWLLFSLVLSAHADLACAQPPAVQYAYDELGRLHAVVDQQGNAAIYSYDAVGNMLSIERFDAATLPGVAITAVVPDKGKAGALVSILGKGFGGAGQNAVAFNGMAASVAQAFSNRIITTVPAGATTGPITIVAPLGSAVSPRPFRIVGALAVTPATATLGEAATQHFVASDGGVVATTSVVWSVDDLVGGDAAAGTISLQGLYVAPATIALARTVRVTATSRDDASVTASAVVTLRPPIPAFLASAPLGVQVAAGATTIVAAGVGLTFAPREAFAGAPAVSVNVSTSNPLPSPPEGDHR
jgi:YD repeat-containing protein